MTQHRTFANLILVLAIAYIAGDGVAIYELHRATNPLSGEGPVVTISLVQLILLVLIILFVVWSRRVRTAFAQAGRLDALRRLPAWVAWRGGVFAALISSILLRANTTDAASYIRDETLYFAIRMVIGLLYIWCAVSMRRAVEALPTEPVGFRASPAAYHPDRDAR